MLQDEDCEQAARGCHAATILSSRVDPCPGVLSRAMALRKTAGTLLRLPVQAEGWATGQLDSNGVRGGRAVAGCGPLLSSRRIAAGGLFPSGSDGCEFSATPSTYFNLTTAFS